mmetsp:Transcript_57762/g.69484  ORF Transcript_57762/g.69484 Transcript_57762/m.69484 type:complete len:85 (+) Transcript_57762:18-272(+)
MRYYVKFENTKNHDRGRDTATTAHSQSSHSNHGHHCNYEKFTTLTYQITAIEQCSSPVFAFDLRCRGIYTSGSGIPTPTRTYAP